MTRRPLFNTSILQEAASTLPSQKVLVQSQDTAVGTALASMQYLHLSAVIVTATGRENSPIIGIFTERDVLHRVIDQYGDLSLLPLNDVMTPDPIVGTQDSTLAWLLHCMSHKGMRHIPIVDENRHPLYVITVRDIMELLVESFPPDAIQ